MEVRTTKEFLDLFQKIFAKFPDFSYLCNRLIFQGLEYLFHDVEYIFQDLERTRHSITKKNISRENKKTIAIMANYVVKEMPDGMKASGSGPMKC